MISHRQLELSLRCSFVRSISNVLPSPGPRQSPLRPFALMQDRPADDRFSAFPPATFAHPDDPAGDPSLPAYLAILSFSGRQQGFPSNSAPAPPFF